MHWESILKEFVARAEAEQLPIEGIALADGESLLFKHCFIPELPRNIYSHTKSYMATAAGIAIDEGKLSLTDRLADFFPESLPSSPDERLLRITLRDLLTMSSGFGKPLLMGADRRKGAGFPDYMAYMLGQPMLDEPGKHFLYSTADSILAGRMIEKAVGMNLGSYLYEKVFAPLSQGWPMWENCPLGHPIGGGGMFMTLSDMLKIGQVYLNGGTFGGRRIVSEDWVKAASSLQIDTGDNPEGNIWKCGYGYQFWLSPYPGAYRADGAYGQVTTVLPEKGLVVAFQCPEIGDFERVKLALHQQVFTQL